MLGCVKIRTSDARWVGSASTRSTTLPGGGAVGLDCAGDVCVSFKDCKVSADGFGGGALGAWTGFCVSVGAGTCGDSDDCVGGTVGTFSAAVAGCGTWAVGAGAGGMVCVGTCAVSVVVAGCVVGVWTGTGVCAGVGVCTDTVVGVGASADSVGVAGAGVWVIVGAWLGVCTSAGTDVGGNGEDSCVCTGCVVICVGSGAVSSFVVIVAVWFVGGACVSAGSDGVGLCWDSSGICTGCAVCAGGGVVVVGTCSGSESCADCAVGVGTGVLFFAVGTVVWSVGTCVGSVACVVCAAVGVGGCAGGVVGAWAFSGVGGDCALCPLAACTCVSRSDKKRSTDSSIF